MISRETVKYKDTEMHVARHFDTCAATAPSATIDVSCIPNSFKRDSLIMVFENSKRYGGGEIEKMDYVAGTGRARIMFKDAAGMCLFVESECMQKSDLMLHIQNFNMTQLWLRTAV